MITLHEARMRVGEEVICQPAGGHAEWGAIAAVGETLVFVRYHGDRDARPARPEDLTFTRSP